MRVKKLVGHKGFTPRNRWCKRCEEKFLATGRFCRLCKKCKKKPDTSYVKFKGLDLRKLKEN